MRKNEVKSRANATQNREVIQTGIIMQKGSEEPAARRNAKRFAGTSVKDAVLKTVRVICSLSAVSGAGLFSCSFFMAAIAKGVAAFPTPKKFALSVAQISSYPLPVW